LENISTTQTQEYWDPINQPIDLPSIQKKQAELLKKVQKYVQKPYLFKLVLFLGIFLPIVFFILFVTVTYTTKHGDIYGVLLIVVLVADLFYYDYYHSLQRNSVLFLLCQAQKWLFMPGDDFKRLSLLEAVFSRLFNRGNLQYISEQVWGNIKKDIFIQFWRGVYTYTVGSGKSSHTYKKTVFAIRLKHTLPVSFWLSRENMLNISDNDLRTESDEFNKTFQVNQEKRNASSDLQVMKALSPSVQLRVLELFKQLDVNSVHFKGEVMMVLFNDRWRVRYTSFLRKVEVDKRDIDSFAYAIDLMTGVSSELVKFI
jgi:hypothetical protein